MRVRIPAVPDAVVHRRASGGGASRPTLLWHHGSPQTGAILEPVAAAADRLGWDVVSLARPAYAGAPRVPGRSVADVAAGIREVLAALDIDQVVSVGASGGGPHALACAAVMPERVRAVVTFASLAPYSGDDAWFEGMIAPDALRAATAGEQSRVRFATHEEFDPRSFNDDDYATLDGAWQSLADDVGAAEQFGAEGLIDDDLAFVRPWGFPLDAVTAPVILVHGDDDRVVPVHHGRALADRLPRASLEIVAGAGHISVLGKLEDALARVEL